jgi:hypothetical protein
VVEHRGVQEGLLGIAESNSGFVQTEGNAGLDVLRTRVMSFGSLGNFVDHPIMEVFGEAMREGNVGEVKGTQWHGVGHEQLGCRRRPEGEVGLDVVEW